MSTRSALAPTLSVTVVRGRVNLKAFCRRFPTTAARTCRSASTATPSSTGIDAEGDAPGVRFHRGGRRELVDEFGDEELLQILDALGEPDLGERAADERVQSHEAAMEHGPGAPRHADVASLEHVEGEDARC